MRIASHVVSVLTALLLVTPSLAGKITIDPNSPEARALVAAEQNKVADPRLAMKVTYSAKKKLVSEIIADLSRATDTPLKAGYNDLDWQVRDRKMSIFVKDMPLGNVMNSLARVMKFKWEISGEREKSSYRLYMDRPAILGAERERKKEAAKAEKRLTDARKALMDAVYSVGRDMSEAELAQLKEENPYLWTMATSGMAKGLVSFFDTCPEAKNSFATGKEWYPNSVAQLSTGAQKVLTDQLVPALIKFGYWGGLKEAPKDLSGNLDQLHIWFNVGGGVAGIMAQIPGRSQAPDGSVMEWSHSSTVRFYEPYSESAKIAAKSCVYTWETGQGYGMPMSEVNAMNTEWQEKFAVPGTGDPAEQHSPDPELQRAVEIKSEPKKTYYIEDIQELLFDHFGLNVIADAYNQKSRIEFTGGTVTAQDLLDLIESKPRNNWWKRGALIEVRDRHWFDRRAEQIPESWLNEWREAFRSTGTLDIDDLSEIASLSLEQYAANIAEDDVLTCGRAKNEELEAIMARDSYARYLLRFYRLTNTQRRDAIFSDTGLELMGTDGKALTEMEFFVGHPVNPWSWLRKDSGVTSIKLSGAKKPVGKQIDYTFKLEAAKDGTKYDDGVSPGNDIHFLTPKYTKPSIP